MQFKKCNTCERSYPDTKEYFTMRLKAGGVWGTVARCKSCDAVARKVLYNAKRIRKLAKERGLQVA